MPPGRRGRRGGFAGAASTRGGAQMLGKRKTTEGAVDEEDQEFSLKQSQSGITVQQQKKMYENQSSFANFMFKKGDIINRFL